MKLANGNTGHAQGIGIILCHFTNCPIIYAFGTVYYCPGHQYDTISSGARKFNVGFQKVTSETLEHCDFAVPQCQLPENARAQNQTLLAEDTLRP